MDQEHEDYADPDLPPPKRLTADAIVYIVLVGLLLAAAASPIVARLVVGGMEWP